MVQVRERSSKLGQKLSGRPHSVDAPAYAIVERLASENSSIIFSYDLAEESDFGILTKDWIGTDPSLSRYVSLQTRTGAGLAIVGRLSEGTSKEGEKNGVFTTYTTPAGLAQMSISLGLLPKPTPSRRLVIQLPAITPVGSDLVLSPTLAPLNSTIYSLSDSFVVLLSSTPQEIVELASVSYNLPSNHVVHVFDQYSSGRENGHLVLPSNVSSNATTIQDALSEIGYGFFDYAGDNEATSVLVLLNGPLATAAKVFASQVPGLGVVVVRVLRPWDEQAFKAALPSTVKTIHVLDEVFSETFQGGLYGDVFGTVFDPSADGPIVKAHRIVPTTTQEYLASPSTFASFLLGISPSSLGLPASSLNLAAIPNLKKLLFFSGANTGSGVPNLIISSFLSHKNIKTRHLAAYDAFSRVGGVVADRILLSNKASVDDHVPIPFLLPLGESVPEHGEGSADFIGISDQALLKTHSILKYARRGAPVLILSNWTPDEVLTNLSYQTLKTVRQRDLHLYVVDAAGIAATLLPDSQDQPKAALAPIVGYLAFLRLYIGQKDEVAKPAVARIAHELYGKSVEGVHVDIVCSKTWYSLASVILPGEAEDVEPEKPITLKDFEFNTVDAESIEQPAEDEAAKVSTWHEAAKHLIFKEAFAAPPAPAATEEEPYSQLQDLRPDIPERTFLVTTSVNRRLTPKEYERNVFHLEFDTQGTGLKYAIGEALGVHGWNDTDEVIEFCKWYGVDANQLVTIHLPHGVPGKEKLLHTRTVFQALQQQVDIFGKPPKSFYANLSKYATKREEQMSLYFISSPEGSSHFKKFSEKDTVTFADILKLYPSARPPIAELCELIGEIEPRHYSIASSQSVVGDRVDLLVVTVDWVTPSGSPRYGQCTKYLAGLKVGQKVTVSIKPSVMRLPPDPMQPIIMAGLGTGAAPFRAFMQHRAWLASRNIPVGPLVYYFGSRHRSQEYLYGEEIEAYIANHVITHAGLAFSRDTKRKIYIQHKMQEDAETLVRHLSREKGVFYLCGPTWPVPDVYEALVGALVKYENMTAEEAGEYLEALKEEERYVLEVY
ncbi:hypothetical protein M422DRAFT_218389 [Sphaerobolus stellatus SS14]|nr:hypothetical protein M422DRAFT_218389 [Sphaerobolus stellatus SS14]